MKIKRLFVDEGMGAFDKIEFEKRSSVIRNPDGSIVFEMSDITVPKQWSQVATDILAQKYFRRAGVPKYLRRILEDNVPSWLQRSEPDNERLEKMARDERRTFENDAKQVFLRLAGCWTYWGWKNNYFDSEADAKNFYEELCYMLA